MRPFLIGVGFCIVVLTVLGVYQQVRITALQAQLNQAEGLPSAIDLAQNQAIVSIEAAASSAVTETTQSLRKILVQTAEQVSQTETKKLQDQLRLLSSKLTEKEQQIAGTDRKLAGLPELVDLDELERVYVSAAQQSKGSSYSHEFTTPKGSITFWSSNVNLTYVPSTQKLAFVRIGKKQSGENAELIKAWLEQATSAKSALGYRKVNSKKRPADYGEYTETEFRKGDMYFKTYFQFERVQGTYNRHSMQYTYYVETGSISRREQHFLELYNRKLGS